MPRDSTLKMLDGLVADGRLTFTTADAADILGSSTAAASNVLTRLEMCGLVDRVARGRFAVRPLGRLGTSAAAEGLALAVGAVFGDRPHRIAYRSALAHHDLIAHPARVIQVACPDQVRVAELSGRPLRVVLEPTGTLSVGAEPLEHGARVSSVERALIDAARRVSLAGGIEIVAEALESASGLLDVGSLADVARAIKAEPALRRLASIAAVRGLHELAKDLADGVRIRHTLKADPGDASPIDWTDDAAGIRWPRAALENVRQL